MGRDSLPAKNHAMAGVGLRHPHYDEIIATQPQIGWFEVHSENFMMAGGPSLAVLETIRKTYPISLHGVGLSLGSSEGINMDHLIKLKRLADRIQPFIVSEHLSWSVTHQRFLTDLIPLPYTEETLTVLTRNVQQVQQFLGRQILIENPSTYLEYKESTLSEPLFIRELLKRSGAGLLLDVNNIYVSCKNHNKDPYDYIRQIPAETVQEIHLAGHTKTHIKHQTIRIDTHDTLVSSEVWKLYRYAIQQIGSVNTLIEWDSNIPQLSILLNEARKAQSILDKETKRYDLAC